MGLRADAKVCSAACRAAKSRAAKAPGQPPIERFWAELGRSPQIAFRQRKVRYGLGVTLTGADAP